MKVRIKPNKSAFVYNQFFTEGEELVLKDIEDINGKTIPAKQQVSESMEVIEAPRKKRAAKKEVKAEDSE